MDDLSQFEPSNLLYTQERIQNYRPGGFHPVSLGDTFKDGRYKVHHKLGFGEFSSVWLARDRIFKKWKALKISRADSPSALHEVSFLKSLHQKHPGIRVAEVLDSFTHEGPNGNHQCTVLQLLGPTLHDIVSDYHRSGGDRLHAKTILKVTRQLLKALSRIRYSSHAHGDISALNIAFTARKLSRLSTKQILQVLGTPKTEKLARKDGGPLAHGLPTQLVEKASWDEWFDEDKEGICIIDLGAAFSVYSEPVKLAEPHGLQVPEMIFTGQCDSRVDLWMAGYTIYYMIMGTIPFQFLGDVDVLVAQMIHFVEDLPEEWKPEWERMKKRSGRNFDDIPDIMPAKSKLQEKFAERAPGPEFEAFLPVIQGLMRFRPCDRLSADNALFLLEKVEIPPARQRR